MFSSTITVVNDDIDEQANVDAVKVNKVNQYIGGFVASLGGFMVGISLGWNSSACIVLKKMLPDATISDIEYIGSAMNIGASVGILFVPLVLKICGCLGAMFMTVPLLVIGWTYISFAGQKIALMISGRFMCGICSGMFCLLTPIYVAEIADQKKRGRLLLLFQLLINCGIMYAFVLAHVVNEQDNVRSFSLSCAAPCIAIILVQMIPESPIYYLTKNNEIAAKKSLKWYRCDGCNIDEEIKELKNLVRSSKTTKMKRRFQDYRVLRSFLACFSVIVPQQLSGINVTISYSLLIFKIGGSGNTTAAVVILVLGATQIAASLLSIPLIDIFGRRIMLTASLLLMGLFLMLLGWYHEAKHIDQEYDLYWWMPPSWIVLLLFSYNIGVGPISWALLGDTFPQEIKVIAATIASSFSWLLSFVGLITFKDMIVSLGVPWSLWLCASFCWLSALSCAIVVKDFERKTLAEIQRDFDIEGTISEPESFDMEAR